MKNNLVWKHLQPLLKNGWIGASVENQQTADERIPLLLQTPAPGRFLSVEPLLGPVDLSEWMYTIKVEHDGDGNNEEVPCRPDINWVIIGGESGPGARPCRVEWIRDLVRQCKAAGVPVFVKQLGSNPVGDDFPEDRDPVTGNRIVTVRQTLTIRDRKGGDMDEWPEDLCVREFPTLQRTA